MENIALFNETFNINKTSTYHITIQISTSSYSYCIIDTIRKRYVALKNTNFDSVLTDNDLLEKIKEIFKTDAFLNKTYKSVDLIYNSEKAILIPNEYFDKSNLKSYYKLNLELNDKEELHFNKLKNLQANNVFAIPSSITTFLVNVFPEINFFHQSSALIENALIKNKHNNNQNYSILIHFNKDFFDVVVTKGTNLVLYNNYRYAHENDCIYFIMSIYQQLQIKPETTELLLEGDIKEGSSMHKLMKQFLKNVKFNKINSNTTYHFDSIPQHFFANLLDLNRCE